MNTMHLMLSGMMGLGLLLGTGCATTTIDFEKPVNTQMTLDGEKYTFPVQVKLRQRTDLPEFSGGYDLNLVVPDPASIDGQIKARGTMYVYNVLLSDVDVLARNFFTIADDKIQALKDGAAVTIEGQSADGGKLLYRAVIGLSRDVN